MHLVHPLPTILHKLGFALNLSWDNCNTQEGYPVFAGKGAGGKCTRCITRNVKKVHSVEIMRRTMKYIHKTVQFNDQNTKYKSFTLMSVKKS